MIVTAAADFAAAAAAAAAAATTTTTTTTTYVHTDSLLHSFSAFATLYKKPHEELVGGRSGDK